MINSTSKFKFAFSNMNYFYKSQICKFIYRLKNESFNY